MPGPVPRAYMLSKTKTTISRIQLSTPSARRHKNAPHQYINGNTASRVDAVQIGNILTGNKSDTI